MSEEFAELYRKYRPQTIDEVIGNDDLKADLEPLISGKRPIPHAIMLIGPSGCGKTTLARILARVLGCEESITELDTGQDNGIAVMREIAAQAKSKGFVGSGRKMFILDEFHRATTDAQNAMLKSLEDCPKHAYFVICTTDPQRVIKTIQTRCTTYQVEPIPERDLVGLMQDICEKENVEVPTPVLKKIAKQSGGSGRLALVNLQRVMGRHPDDMDKDITQISEAEELTKELCQALLRRAPWKEVAKYLKSIDKTEPETVRRMVLGYMNAVLLSGKDAAQAALVIESFKEPLYNTGKAGLTLAAYYAVNAE